jgi:hypothetical protein
VWSRRKRHIPVADDGLVRVARCGSVRRQQALTPRERTLPQQRGREGAKARFEGADSVASAHLLAGSTGLLVSDWLARPNPQAVQRLRDSLTRSNCALPHRGHMDPRRGATNRAYDTSRERIAGVLTPTRVARARKVSPGPLATCAHPEMLVDHQHGSWSICTTGDVCHRYRFGFVSLRFVPRSADLGSACASDLAAREVGSPSQGGATLSQQPI